MATFRQTVFSYFLPLLNMVHVLPFVSVLDGQAEARFPISVYESGQCECHEVGGCSSSAVRFGDDDSHSPVFCAKHFRNLHEGARKQSHIEPMTDEELACSFTAPAPDTRRVVHNQKELAEAEGKGEDVLVGFDDQQGV